VKKLALGLVYLQLLSGSAHAYDLGVAGTNPMPPAQTSEYIYRVDSDEPLISIYLLGAVGRPGLYHVPTKMDLLSLLTLAGGALAGAETDRILIKGQEAGPSDRQIRFDLEGAVRGEGSARVPLMSNDVVYVTPGKAGVSTTLLTVVGIVSGVLGIVATSVLLTQNLKK
jgi:hypothetical protein